MTTATERGFSTRSHVKGSTVPARSCALVWNTLLRVENPRSVKLGHCHQIRAVDKSRLVKRLGKLDSQTATAILDTLAELFAL